MAPRLTFYHRNGCHLCEEMWQQLHSLPGADALVVEQVDISVSQSLQAQYGRLIPVLVAGDEILCHYYLDPMALKPYLEPDV